MEKKYNLRLLYMLIPAFVLLILFTYIPIVRGGIMAFQYYNMFNLNIRFCGLENFKAIIFDKNFNFWRILSNTAVWVFVSFWHC